jgi:hypothetical protein
MSIPMGSPRGPSVTFKSSKRQAPMTPLAASKSPLGLALEEGHSTLKLQGVGPIFVRLTASEGRLLAEAERGRLKLPLDAGVLRKVDMERNRQERYGGNTKLKEDLLAIPRLVGGSGSGDGPGMDPYACHYAPFCSTGLPASTAKALESLGLPATPSSLFSKCAPDGQGILSDVSSLKLIHAIVCAPVHAGGAGLDLGVLQREGAFSAVFAGHCYSAREAVYQAGEECSWNVRSFGVGYVATVVAGLVARWEGGGLHAARRRPPPTSHAHPPGSDSALRHAALLGSLTGHPAGEAVLEEFDEAGDPVFIPASHYIRAYCGETVGMYFALNEYYQQSLATLSLVGLGVFAYQRVVGRVEVNVLPGYAFATALWALMFHMFWAQRQDVTTMRWGMRDFKATEDFTPAFKEAPQVKEVRGNVDGKRTYQADPSVQLYRLTLSNLTTVGAFVLTVGACFCIFLLRLLLLPSLGANGGDNLTALINNLWIATGNTLWGIAAFGLTGWETQATATAFHTSFVLKSSLFRIVNTFASLFYISMTIKNSVAIQGVSDQCDPRYEGRVPTPEQLAAGAATPDCITELYGQLYVQMAVNWVVCFGFVHLANPAGRVLGGVVRWWKRGCGRRRGGRVGPGGGGGGGGEDAPVSEALYKLAAASCAQGERRVKEGGVNLCPTPRDLWLRILHESGSGFLNFTEMYLIILLQFGYIALFSPAFPLAGAVAIVANLIGFRVDLWGLLKNSMRPIPTGTQDIGAWNSLFLFLALLSILTNCLVITVATTQPLFTVHFPGYTVSDMKCVEKRGRGGGGLRSPFLSCPASPLVRLSTQHKKRTTTHTLFNHHPPPPHSRLIWFVAAETGLVFLAFLAWGYFGGEPFEAKLQRERCTYLTLKVFGGVEDRVEAPLTTFSGKGGQSLDQVVRSIAGAWGVHEEALVSSPFPT